MSILYIFFPEIYIFMSVIGYLNKKYEFKKFIDYGGSVCDDVRICRMFFR